MSSLIASLETHQQRRPRVVADGLARDQGTAGLILAFALTVALSLVASPQRTGDAHQYLAMAMQLSRLQPPSLSPAAERSFRTWLATQPEASGFPGGARAIRQPALIRHSHQEFSHFWVFPLLVAPVMVMTETAGAHPIIAFTLANAAILGAALWASARVFGPVIALLILATPVIWFVARAQVEVFTVALLSLAMAAAATGRWGWASIAVATASTQNAPIAVAVPLFWIAALVDWRFSQRSAGHSIRPTRRQTWRALGFVLGGVVLAFLHPLYYVLRLGVLTPQQLNGGIAGKVPSLAAVLAPVVDPDIGFVAWMPVGACLALVGLCLTARRAREMLAEQRHLVMATALSVVVGLWLLAVVTQTTNVNSGGTVHISRYALWFLPLTAPAMTVAVGAIEARSSLMLPVASTALFLLNLGYFRPSQPEQYVTHSPQADWLMTHLPAPYRPVPEIFVERTLHIDGGATASAASPDCRLILVLASAPSQPCPLTETDSAAMARHFGAGDTAVWLRGTIGERSVSTAIAGP